VQIVGDATLRSALMEALGRRAIGTEVIRGCPSLRAQVTRQGGLVKVVLQEDVPREERLVTDLATVVTLIETWLRSDISAPLLSAMLAPPAELSTAEPVAPPPPPTLRPRPLGALELLGEAGVNVNETSWFGGQLRGCVRTGPLCLGAAWRMAGDLLRVVGEDTLRQRITADFLASAEWPLSVGRFTFAPGIGIGAGWIRSQFTHSSARSEEPGEGLLSSPIIVNDGGMRAEVRFLTAVTLYRGLQLAASIAGDASFLDSPETTLKVGTRQTLVLPTTAWGMLRGGLGLRWSL
jgi:hypothetical protein